MAEQTYQSTGTVGGVYANARKDGKGHWYKIIIDDQNYSTFDSEVADSFQKGAEVAFEWKKSGNFRNIVKKIDPPSGGAVVNNRQPPTNRDKSIVQQVCLKCATELVASDAQLTLSNKVDYVVAIMRHFNEKMQDPENHTEFEIQGAGSARIC